MYQILENLYQGGVKRVLPDDIKSIICLVEDPYMPENPFQIECYIWRPIVDAAQVNQEWFEKTVQMVKTALTVGKTYVHCAAGISRSTAVVAAYLMIENDWNYDKALNFIAEKNPTLNPAESFMQVLKNWK